MAAEVNGLYGQPAELAASTPSAPSHAASGSVASTTTSAPAKPDPREVGWFFVEQYYTTLSKNPDKIPLFYNRRSQFIHGIEAEKVLPAVGVKAIGERVKALDIQDCKVRVLNVDSQASYDNIVVQVIGELSNRSEPHNKFVQTFVLAAQPNGYFVLNDIFRYLNNDENEIVEDEPESQPPTAPEEVTIPAEEEPMHTQEMVTTESAAEEVDAKLVDGDTTPAVAAQQEEPVEEEHEEAATATDSSLAEHTETTADLPEEPPADVVAEEKPTAPEQTPAQSPPKTSSPPPTTDVPPARKTWASMVGIKAAPAIPVLPNTSQPNSSGPPRTQRTPQPPTAAKTSSESSPVPAASATSPIQANGWTNVDSSKSKNKPVAKPGSDQITLAYIKNVNEKVDARVLKEVLETFGELKYFDVSRPRNCAFVEFATPEGYAAAVTANPHDVGGEIISVEERRPRPTAYGGSNTSFTRGAANSGRGARGGAYPKETRGGFQQRGNKSGTVTPRGRGQPQAI